jgi:uncharacterized protein YndB with AHSA1/START domain
MGDLPVYRYKRYFSLPCALVWRGWTDPALLAQWYGPGVETVIHQFDLRPGGEWRSEMRWNGRSDFSLMRFVKVKEGAQLVWRHQAVDQAWQPAPSQLIPDWPQSMVTQLALKEGGDGRTKLLLTLEPEQPTDAEAACFAQMMAGLDSGWDKGFDHMEQLLTELV